MFPWIPLLLLSFQIWVDIVTISALDGCRPVRYGALVFPQLVLLTLVGWCGSQVAIQAGQHEYATADEATGKLCQREADCLHLDVGVVWCK